MKAPLGLLTKPGGPCTSLLDPIPRSGEHRESTCMLYVTLSNCLLFAHDLELRHQDSIARHLSLVIQHGQPLTADGIV